VTIQLPPLNSSSTGPPQKLVRQATQGPLPRDCSMRSSKGGCHEAGHVDQLVNGYRPRLAPGNLVRYLAKGQSSTDLIHTKSTQVFWSFGHLLARTPRRGQDDPALGHCLGRNAPQRVRPEGGGRSSTKPYISPRGWCQGLVVRGAAGRWLLARVPSRRGPARQPGDRNHPKVVRASRTVKKFASTPDRDDP
jgi:hypothetical protein